MSQHFRPAPPLPFSPDDVNTLPFQERAHPDVVEPRLVSGARDVVDFVDARHTRIGSDNDVDVSNAHHEHLGAGHDDDSRATHDATDQHDQHDQHDVAEGSKDSEHSDQRTILQRDRFERERARLRRQPRGLNGRRRGPAEPPLLNRRRPPRRPWRLAVRHEWGERADSALRQPRKSSARQGRRWRESELPIRDRSRHGVHAGHVASQPEGVKHWVSGPLNGTALALYFALLPYVVLTRWHLAHRGLSGDILRTLLVVLAVFWIAFLVQMVRNVARVRRGLSAGVGASAWLAGLVVALMTLLGTPTSTTSITRALAPNTSAGAVVAKISSRTPFTPTRPALAVPSLVPLALMAKRRSDLLRQHQFIDTDMDVDSTIELLRGRRPDLVAHLRWLARTRRDGVLDIAHNLTLPENADDSSNETCVASYLGPSPTGSLVGFAREGGRLPIRPEWADQEIRDSIVALHEGRLTFVDTPEQLLRALATRSLHHTTVVYLGAGEGLDTELAGCCISVGALAGAEGGRPRDVDSAASSSAHPIRVSLLRSDPSVVGLGEPFTPTLRRRCLEMLAYLALHRHEPVTGDRLRSRVLTHADVDASMRTLANTASAVRRSLGADDAGPRLHAVSASGLYVTHGVTSDVEEFTDLVARARRLSVPAAAPLAHRALAMVKGEPLASALRGYEWFLAEGFAARLSRDAEWAALVLHHDAMNHERYELAFWALQQGRLVDPFSAVLLEESARVPRLRQFGRDGADVAQDQPVRARGAVAMSWSLRGFSNQISQ